MAHGCSLLKFLLTIFCVIQYIDCGQYCEARDFRDVVMSVRELRTAFQKFKNQLAEEIRDFKNTFDKEIEVIRKSVTPSTKETTTIPTTMPTTTISTPTTSTPTPSTTTEAVTTTATPVDHDCLDIHTRMPHAPSGPYNITIGGSRSLMVWCDMTTAGGGWTVFQKRFNGSVDFYQTFAAYRDGFGSVHGGFWLGLENIHQLTVGHNNTLRVDTIHYNGTHLHDTIPSFNVGPGDQYVLHVADDTKSPSASLEMLYFNGQAFSTKDADRDSSSTHCAVEFHGAFWYNHCYLYAHPNGRYAPGENGVTVMTYYDRIGNRAIELKFRRIA